MIGCLIGLVASSSGTGELYVGLYRQPFTILSSSPTETFVPLFGLCVCLSIALVGAPGASKTFSEERAVYMRESTSGHSMSAYYLGKTVVVLLRIAITSLHYAAFLAYIAKPLTSFWRLYAIVFVLFYCVYGLSSFVSLLVRRENASLLAVIVTLFVGIFNGFGPNVKSMTESGWLWLLQMSYSRWATEALYSEELMPYKPIYLIEYSAEMVIGFTLDRYYFDLCISFFFFFGICDLVLGLFKNKK